MGKKPHNYRDRTCHKCGAIFKPTTSRQRFCTKQCSNKNAYQKYREYKGKWSKENASKLVEYKKKWLENNKEQRRESSSNYRKRNSAYYRQYSSLRSRHLKVAQPSWVNKEDLLDIYKEAVYFQLEVDHIVPLKHPDVCGLHVPWNLQLLTRSQNARKSNSFDDVLGVVTDD